MSTGSFSKYKNLLTGKKSNGNSQGTIGREVRFTTPSYRDPIAIYSFLSNSIESTITVFHRGHPIGTIHLDTFSSTINILLHGRSFSLKKDTMSLSGRYSFMSPVTRHERLSWKLKGVGLGFSKDWKLINAEGLLLATWRAKMESYGEGKLNNVEFSIEPGMVFLDVVVMSGIAVSEMKKAEDKVEEEVAEEVISAVVGA